MFNRVCTKTDELYCKAQRASPFHDPPQTNRWDSWSERVLIDFRCWRMYTIWCLLECPCFGLLKTLWPKPYWHQTAMWLVHWQALLKGGASGKRGWTCKNSSLNQNQKDFKHSFLGNASPSAVVDLYNFWVYWKWHCWLFRWMIGAAIGVAATCLTKQKLLRRAKMRLLCAVRWMVTRTFDKE